MTALPILAAGACLAALAAHFYASRAIFSRRVQRLACDATSSRPRP